MEGIEALQQRVMKVLLKEKKALGIQAIAARVGISRPSVRWHLVALGRSGYVKPANTVESGGRPVQTYALTPKGKALFPKQYSWFSEVLLENLKSRFGSAELEKWMEAMGRDVAAQASASITGGSLAERVERIARLMSDLAYEAETVRTGIEGVGSPPAIEAHNCVFHSLAAKFPEICRFDVALLTELAGAKVDHDSCILRGGKTCRFRFREHPRGENTFHSGLLKN